MNKLSEIIVKEIEEKGVITFARFMELALYCPNYGFYETETDNPGAGGHFYTSVSVGPLFGELLAIQFAEWFDQAFGVHPSGCQDLNRANADTLKGGHQAQLIEAGAHDGRLASDILAWFATHRPELLARLEYCIIEPSTRRRQWQEKTLAKFNDRVRWASSLADLPCHPSPAARHPFQIIFSNELLDAMPVHRLCWDANARKWFEMGVTFTGSKFQWQGMAQSPTHDFGLRTLDSGLLAVLPDGFLLDVSPSAEGWWRDVACLLIHGKLLTLDYGLTSEELFQPERKEGTLRAYRLHRMLTDVLADPGEQDLTAHVNFSAIQAAGEAAGLRTESFVTQERFLTEIVARNSEGQPAAISWTPARKRQFQTLTHPDLMGRRFRVLIQSR